jgi:hypothetical protein
MRSYCTYNYYRFVGTLEIEYLADVLAFQSADHFKTFLGYFGTIS